MNSFSKQIVFELGFSGFRKFSNLIFAKRKEKTFHYSELNKNLLFLKKNSNHLYLTEVTNTSATKLYHLSGITKAVTLR